MTRKLRLYIQQRELKSFFKGFAVGTLIVLALHFLWILKGGC